MQVTGDEGVGGERLEENLTGDTQPELWGYIDESSWVSRVLSANRS